MSDGIFIHQACFPCHIGVTPEERAQAQDVLIDADLSINLSSAGHSDSIRDTIDYRDIWRLMNDCIASREFHLVEALATRIGAELLERFTSIESAEITVTKPRALAARGVNSAGVRITVSRDAAR